MDNKWDGNKPAAIRLAPAESGAGAGPLPARCWHDGGSDGSAGAGPLQSQFALSPPVRCRLRRGWPQLPEPARWWAASAMLSGQPHDCLLNRLFSRRSKKTQSSATLAFMWGIHRCSVNSPHKWPVTRKMVPFGDIIMLFLLHGHLNRWCKFQL